MMPAPPFLGAARLQPGDAILMTPPFKKIVVCDEEHISVSIMHKKQFQRLKFTASLCRYEVFVVIA